MGKKVREVVKTCHIQTFQKKSIPQGNETCTCLQKFRIDSERNVKFNHLHFKFDCSNFQVFLHTMFKKKLNSRYGIYVPVGWQIYARHGKASGRTFFSDKPTVVFTTVVFTVRCSK